MGGCGDCGDVREHSGVWTNSDIWVRRVSRARVQWWPDDLTGKSRQAAIVVYEYDPLETDPLDRYKPWLMDFPGAWQRG
jgi:hypothetical protein